MQIVFFMIATTASTIGAMSGIGGGIIIKPVMDALQVMDIASINFLSGCTVLTMATYSFIKNRNDEIKLNYKITSYITIGASVGGYVGKIFFDRIDSGLAVIQSANLLILNVFVLLYILNKKKIISLNIVNPWMCLATGLALGTVSSFLGIGGGPINIAVLYYFFSMNSKEAAKNSLFIILFSQTTSLCTTLATKTVPAFDTTAMIVMCAGGILGAHTGSSISRKMDSLSLERFFLSVLCALILINFYNLAQSIQS